MLRALVAERMDQVLFGYSYDYVGDLAETISLVWPEQPAHSMPNPVPTLGDVVASLQSASRTDGPACWRDCSTAPASARYALLKLVTGGLRIGVSARLAKQALAEFGKVDVTEIEELWHGLSRPTQRCSPGWRARRRQTAEAGAAPFRPVMLSNAARGPRPRKARSGRLRRRMEMGRHPRAGGVRRRQSGGSIRAPATISPAPFPTSSMPWISTARSTASCWSAHPPRGRSAPSPICSSGSTARPCRQDARKLSRLRPLYDLLLDGDDDMRALPFTERRARASRPSSQTLDPTRFDLSPLVPFDDWDASSRCARTRRIRSSKG